MEEKDLKNIKLTVSQEKVLKQITDFVDSPNGRVFILKGYAGTGKTTLMRFLIKYLESKEIDYKLLASTGRAAKVLGNLSEKNGETSTIHSMIYTYGGFNKDLEEGEEETVVDVDDTGQLHLVFNCTTLDADRNMSTIYIIDEASMVSDIETKDVTQAKFGSGRLLKELLDYDTRKGSKYIFVGDPCQLPPIEEYYSPALMPEYFLKNFGIKAQEARLTEIMRQDDSNDIIYASKKIRGLYNQAPEDEKVYGTQRVWGKLPFRNCKNIILHPDLEEMTDSYVAKIKKYGYNSAIMVCRSNSECSRLSHIIREKLGIKSSRATVGDQLLVIQNNAITGLMNGAMVRIVDISNKVERRAGLLFRNVKVMELFTHMEYETLLMEDLLYMQRLNLDSYQQQSLYLDFIMRMKRKGITQKRTPEEFKNNLFVDPYLNALRCSFGYAITCHKSQGGEWDDVYVSLPRSIVMNPTKEKYQWVYTSMTRAVNKLHIVKDFFIGY